MSWKCIYFYTYSTQLYAVQWTPHYIGYVNWPIWITYDKIYIYYISMYVDDKEFEISDIHFRIAGL